MKAVEIVLGNSVAGTNLVHLYFCFCSSYNGILCDRCIKPYPAITIAVLFHRLWLCQMQHEALAHLHLPDALLSFWRADVLTHHASKSSALFYCLTETCSNQRCCLHVTHQLHLYSTPPDAQMLPWNCCSLSPFCSNTSSAHWFYSSAWDCYCNILEYLSDFFVREMLTV